MDISAVGSGMDQITRSTQVMGDLLKMAVSETQELGNKMIKISAESKVAAGELGSRVDVQG